jgi:hypothetical protein
MLDLSRWASALVVAVCVVLLVRLLLPAHLRMQFDRRVRALPAALRQRWHRLRHGRRRRVDAEKLARDAIERARKTPVERDGNVIKPDAFKGPRKPH